MARSTKGARRRSPDAFLCFDLGGTKLLAARVNSRGRVLSHVSRRVQQEQGLNGLIRDFRELGEECAPDGDYSVVSVASAGPLHGGRGVLLDPTNFFTEQKSWGVVPLVARLKAVFKCPVYLENDAAAAVLAEGWRGGHGRSAQNLVVMTLGTGVGVGVIANGQLVRAGQGLHPEVSHTSLNSTDMGAPCGCGAHGCIEAYLAGTHFARRLSAVKGRDLTGEDGLALAAAGDAQAREAFALYGQHLAQAIRSLAVLFAPELVVLAGGFARCSPHFLPTAQSLLPTLLSRYRDGVDLLPQLKVSKLGELAGVIGAARVAVDVGPKNKKGLR